MPSFTKPLPAPCQRDSFGRLYRQSYAKILAYCLTNLHNREDAEDATQATFTRAFASWSCYAERGSGEAWLRTIARHEVIDRVRSDRRHRLARPRNRQGRAGVELEDVAEHRWRCEPEAFVEHWDAVAALDRGLRLMQPDLARLVAARHLSHVSYAELAQASGKNESHVRVLAHRGRRQLAGAIDVGAA